MKTVFKFFTLMLITSWSLQAQTETIYSKSYETDAHTTALLEFSGSSVEISTSPDNKFYVEYSIEFINYPKRKKKAAIEKINIESELVNNHIILKDISKFNSYRFYQFNTIMGHLNAKNDAEIKSYKHKPEDAVSNEINEAKKPVPFYIRYIQNSKQHNEDEKKRSIEKYNNRKRKKYNRIFRIKVPSHLNLTINSKASSIRIKESIENELTLRVDGGRLYVKDLNNPNNVIKIKDATLIANSIAGGELILDNAKRTVIGVLKDVKLNSEFSQLEIGQIKNNVEIIDFTSKYIIHNFSNDFEALIMNTEYSEINLFLPEKLNYNLNTYGNYTKHYVDNEVFDFPEKRGGTNAKMLEMDNNIDKSTPNEITINTVNGIIRVGKDAVDLLFLEIGN
ncbi:hypothetical protein [Psychroserpens sp.]